MWSVLFTIYSTYWSCGTVPAAYLGNCNGSELSGVILIDWDYDFGIDLSLKN